MPSKNGLFIDQAINVFAKTSRHQSAREETGENKNTLKIVMFNSQEYCQDRPQGLKRGENKHSRI